MSDTLTCCSLRRCMIGSWIEPELTISSRQQCHRTTLQKDVTEHEAGKVSLSVKRLEHCDNSEKTANRRMTLSCQVHSTRMRNQLDRPYFLLAHSSAPSNTRVPCAATCSTYRDPVLRTSASARSLFVTVGRLGAPLSNPLSSNLIPPDCGSLYRLWQSVATVVTSRVRKTRAELNDRHIYPIEIENSDPSKCCGRLTPTLFSLQTHLESS